MPSGVYTRAKYLLGGGDLAWDSAIVVRALLVDAAYTFADAHQFVSDVIANEVADPSYSRVDVTARTTTQDLGGSRALLDAEDILFAGIDVVTIGGAVLYQQIGGDDTAPTTDSLICFIEMSPAVVADGSNLLVELDPDGLIQLL